MGMGLANSGRAGRRSRRAPMSEINVTPFVDVMLVLLIIFMVTAPLLASGVPVELPDSRANPIDQQPDQVTISIDPTGTIFIGNERVEAGGLPDALAAIDRGTQGNEPVIVLRGDRTLQYARVMAVMGELNRAGFNSISLVTNSSQSAP
ncbi:MAG: ExbD/TolR family protein [Altererythrobacter sp.]|nr:ExbD/TolR family protein [Altererythrobacter sp.]MBT8432608.1 ExbD/TolR family protein [Altererythrobacter sp.]NNE49900.1 ExbD/TolR family protein [Altererythrobacter sp.]NNF93123.1 ExbD/TolR family protein [Altererythrobacter sp.]NNK46783.1 ExbD/TolR family protein [Altererythrobacter sp.]